MDKKMQMLVNAVAWVKIIVLIQMKCVPKGVIDNVNGFVQDCSNSSALAMASLQYCTKPSICR